MAGSSTAARLTEQHRLAQVRLGAEVVAATLPTWSMFDLDDIDAGTEDWLKVMTPIVANARTRSAVLAAQYYAAFRYLELNGQGGNFVPPVADKVNRQALGVSLVVTGPIAFKIAMRSGKTPARAADIASSQSAGAAMRHALAGGRETLTNSVKSDRRAKGYARVTSGSPCEFCSMLADRGAVYGEESGDFEAHDHCSCSAEPVFD